MVLPSTIKRKTETAGGCGGVDREGNCLVKSWFTWMLRNFGCREWVPGVVSKSRSSGYIPGQLRQNWFVGIQETYMYLKFPR